MENKRDYRLASEAEVVAHAESLIGTSLRAVYGDALAQRKGKGAFGQLLEQAHFGYEPNSVAEQDFVVAGLELKATGAELKQTGWRAKERLVLSNINYQALAHETDYFASSFYLKNDRLLLVVYFWLAGLAPEDFTIVGVGVVDIADLNPADRAIIEDDWRRIRQSVVEGRAHELSEADTNYLKATRKGAGTGRDDRSQPYSDAPAPNRAFSFKQSFLTQLIRTFVVARPAPTDTEAIVTDVDQLKEKPFDQVVLERFERFRGRAVQDIAAELDLALNPQSKAFYANLARRMLGVKTRRIEEFEKADIVMKTVRIRADGRPAESMSFPAFRYRDIVTQTWLDSDLRELLTKRFLFVFFQEAAGEVYLHHATFWAMPENVLDGEVHRVWQATVDLVKSDQAERFPRESESPLVHVRPHARNAADTDSTPGGKRLVKRSFWLNRGLIGKIFQDSDGA